MSKRPPTPPLLTHLDEEGRARMVDVGDKPLTQRMAVAVGALRTAAETVALIHEGATAKGDPLLVGELAGIMAAKRTADLIPLCHPLPLSGVQVRLELDPSLPGVRVSATVRTSGRTGVEMEALTAASFALLAVYDMCKAVDREMSIEGIRVVEKRGGRSGDWTLS